MCTFYNYKSYLYIYKLRSTNFIDYILNPSTLTRAKRRLNPTVICESRLNLCLNVNTQISYIYIFIAMCSLYKSLHNESNHIVL